MIGKSFTDRIRRLSVGQHEVMRNALKFVTHNESIPLTTRYVAQFRLNALPKASSYYRLSPRCVLTGRGHGFIKEFNISRIEFKRLAQEGKLADIQNSSW